MLKHYYCKTKMSDDNFFKLLDVYMLSDANNVNVKKEITSLENPTPVVPVKRKIKKTKGSIRSNMDKNTEYDDWGFENPLWYDLLKLGGLLGVVVGIYKGFKTYRYN